MIEAAANGAADGWRLALNVGAMLLAFVALIAMIDYPLNWIGQWSGFEAFTGRELGLSTMLGYILSPLAWVIGVPWQGRGLATEAARAMVAALGADGVDRLTAHVHPEHAASAAVAARLGLERTAQIEDGEVVWRGSVPAA